MAKKPLTVSEAIETVLRVVWTEIGYVSRSWENSKYGKASSWASKWLWGTVWQGYWCARFLSWAFDQAFGTLATKAIGRQGGTPLPVGWAATWLWLNWFRLKPKLVIYDRTNSKGAWKNAQRGDIVLMALAGPRNQNETNHVGMFVKWKDYQGGTAVVAEGNWPKAGQGNSTIGVHYQERNLSGSWGKVMAVCRPDWDALVAAHNATLPAPKPEPKPKPKPKPKPAPAPKPKPDTSKVRIAGRDRYATGAEWSRRGRPAGSDTVYLASGVAPWDALSVTSNIGHGDLPAGPLLLVHPERLPGPVAAELKRLKPKRILVAGSADAVSDKVVIAAHEAAGIPLP